MDNIKKLLNEEIERELVTLEDMDMGSNEQSNAIDDVTKLIDKRIAMEKMEVENQQKEKQIKDEQIDRIVKNSLTGISIIGGFALTVWGTIKSIKFEETGTITTIMGRGFINKLLPKK